MPERHHWLRLTHGEYLVLYHLIDTMVATGRHTSADFESLRRKVTGEVEGT